MKTPLFTARQVMACLMLISAGAFAGDDHKDVSAVFHLSAKYKNVTCNQQLLTDGNSGNTTIDFGTFSSDTPEKTVPVVLTLDCSNGTDLPETVKVGFKVINPATVEGSQTNRLYPSGPDGSPQAILYYDWVWGNDINGTVKTSVGDNAHKILSPGSPVDLSSASGADVYEVADQSAGSKQLRFPLDITRNVGRGNTGYLAAGDYTAAVTVTVSYE